MKKSVIEKVERKLLKIFGSLRFECNDFFGLRVGILEYDIGRVRIGRKVDTKIVDVISLQRDVYFFLCCSCFVKDTSCAGLLC